MIYNLEKLKKPMPFEQGEMTLWENEYIAANVLKKHLNPNIDSGSRKRDTIVNSINWFANINPQKGNLLDVGCGPGLYARPLEKAGFFYYGIDISKYHIAFAKKNYFGNNIEFDTLDFRKINCNKLYNMVLMLYGIYSFYPPNERLELLKKIRSSLAFGGMVIVEVFTENHYKNRKESRDWEYIQSDGFWSDKPYLELNAFYRYDDLRLILIQTVRINKEIKVWNSWIQTFISDTLRFEFEQAGFTEFEFYSSCTGTPYFESTDVLCMVAK